MCSLFVSLHVALSTIAAVAFLRGRHRGALAYLVRTAASFHFGPTLRHTEPSIHTTINQPSSSVTPSRSSATDSWACARSPFRDRTTYSMVQVCAVPGGLEAAIPASWDHAAGAGGAGLRCRGTNRALLLRPVLRTDGSVFRCHGSRERKFIPCLSEASTSTIGSASGKGSVLYCSHGRRNIIEVPLL